MTDTRVSNATFDSRLTTLETNFAVFVQEMKDFKDEMRDFKNETRQQVAEIRQSVQSMNNHVRNLTITAMIGIGAMVITVIYSVHSVLSK